MTQTQLISSCVFLLTAHIKQAISLKQAENVNGDVTTETSTPYLTAPSTDTTTPKPVVVVNSVDLSTIEEHFRDREIKYVWITAALCAWVVALIGVILVLLVFKPHNSKPGCCVASWWLTCCSCCRHDNTRSSNDIELGATIAAGAAAPLLRINNGQCENCQNAKNRNFPPRSDPLPPPPGAEQPEYDDDDDSARRKNTTTTTSTQTAIMCVVVGDYASHNSMSDPSVALSKSEIDLVHAEIDRIYSGGSVTTGQCVQQASSSHGGAAAAAPCAYDDDDTRTMSHHRLIYVSSPPVSVKNDAIPCGRRCPTCGHFTEIEGIQVVDVGAGESTATNTPGAFGVPIEDERTRSPVQHSESVDMTSTGRK